MAGGWGYEQGRFDISVGCGEQSGEQKLLPAVRAADQDTVVVANRFSCKTQIQQVGGGRNALHLAQVVAMAREHGRDGNRGGHPEEPYYLNRPEAGARRRARRILRLGGAAALVSGAAVAGALTSGR